MSGLRRKFIRTNQKGVTQRSPTRSTSIMDTPLNRALVVHIDSNKSYMGDGITPVRDLTPVVDGEGIDQDTMIHRLQEYATINARNIDKVVLVRSDDTHGDTFNIVDPAEFITRLANSLVTSDV